MDVTRTVSEGYKIYLAGGGVLLAAIWRFIPRRWAIGALVVLTLVAGLNYARWGPKLPLENYDSYDLMHYYLTAKYFDELGYYDLYPAMAYADWRNQPHSEKLNIYRDQDPEKGYRIRRIADGITKGEAIRHEKFSEERWWQFEHDFLHLQRGPSPISPSHWQTLMGDRGYNGTPVWTMIARPITWVVPVERIKMLAWLDVLLLFIALGFVRWGYDWTTTLWCAFFLAVSYSLRWPVPSWVFLRYDWVACLMIAMALLKRGRGVVPGILTGLAGLYRLFPVVWMFGPFFKGVTTLLRRGKPFLQRLDRTLLWMALGFVGAMVVLEGVAIAVFGMDVVLQHIENIREHVQPEELSSRRVGFAIAYIYEGGMEPKIITNRMKDLVATTKSERLYYVAPMLLLLGWGTRNLRRDESFGYGFIPFFLLATFSYYYAVCRITLIIAHASDLSKLRNKVGLVMLLALEVFCNWAEVNHRGYRMYLIGHMAWWLTVYAALMCMWAAVGDRLPRFGRQSG